MKALSSILFIPFIPHLQCPTSKYKKIKIRFLCSVFGFISFYEISSLIAELIEHTAHSCDQNCISKKQYTIFWFSTRFSSFKNRFFQSTVNDLSFTKNNCSHWKFGPYYNFYADIPPVSTSISWWMLVSGLLHTISPRQIREKRQWNETRSRIFKNPFLYQLVFPSSKMMIS